MKGEMDKTQQFQGPKAEYGMTEWPLSFKPLRIAIPANRRPPLACPLPQVTAYVPSFIFGLSRCLRKQEYQNISLCNVSAHM